MKNNKGWECPKCGNVYSPTIEECSNCNGERVVYIPIYPYIEPCPQPYRISPTNPWEPIVTYWDDCTATQPPSDYTIVTC